MLSRYLISIALVAALAISSFAQIDHWTKLRVGDFVCDFPAAYTSIRFTGASGVHYEGGTIFMTITSLPDTFPMKGSLDRDFSRDFQEVVLQTSRRLQGRVREYRDTVIANMPGYLSVQEVRFPNGNRSNYELLLLLDQDSIRAFSSQYYTGNPRAVQDTKKFFQSIRFEQNGSPATGKGRIGLWIGGGVILVIALWAAFFRRRH